MSELEVPHRPANVVNDTILRYGEDHTPEEISVMLKGVISPEGVAAHAQKLLKSKPWFTAAQSEVALILQMRRVLHDIEDQHQDANMLNLRLKTLKEIGVRLDKRQAATETDLNSFYAAQAVQVGQVIELALQRTLTALQKAHPELEEAEVRAALKSALPAAAAEIQARTVNE